MLAAIAAGATDAPEAERLFLEALTHRTWVNEHPGLKATHNQRLELLGDAVLELVVTDALYRRLPGADEGLLSRTRAAIVNEGSLAEGARALQLGPALRLGRGEAASGRDRNRTLADALEAVVAAAYLTFDLAGAGHLVQLAIGTRIDEVVSEATRSDAVLAHVDLRAKDAKSVLQELVQRGGRPPPTYDHDEPEGPVHARTFRARVSSDGRLLGVGEGASRQEAERQAASVALVEWAKGSEQDRPEQDRLEGGVARRRSDRAPKSADIDTLPPKPRAP